MRSDLKTACTPSAVARSVRRSRCSSRSVSPSLARSDCTAGEPLSACVRSASRSVPAGGSGVDAVIPQLWRGVLTRGGLPSGERARGWVSGMREPSDRIYRGSSPLPPRLFRLFRLFHACREDEVCGRPPFAPPKT